VAPLAAGTVVPVSRANVVGTTRSFAPGPKRTRGTDVVVRERAPARGGTAVEAEAPPVPAWAPDERARRLVNLLGNNNLASLMGVSPSQPSRWKSGAEVPGTLAAPLLVDLDHVVARLLLVWDESLVTDWLTTANSFLEGARPIDVLARRGSTEVVEAIEAEAAGAYA
jgi:hypothetical protein